MRLRTSLLVLLMLLTVPFLLAGDVKQVPPIQIVSETECIMLDASAINCDTTAGCATVDVAGDLYDYTVADFADGANDQGAWAFELPSNLTGTTATVQFVWLSNDVACDDGATRDVCWTIEGDSFGQAGDIDGGTLSGTAIGQTDKCEAVGAINISDSITFTHSMLPDETAVVQVSREVDGDFAGGNCNGATDDDFAATASLRSVRFCYSVSDIFSGN